MRVKYKPWAKDYISEKRDFFLSEEDLNAGNPFPNNNPIHLELGMGKGQFIMSLAKQNPEINYIGVELQASAQVMAGKKLEEEPLANVRLYNQDVAKLLEHKFWINSIERIYLNFSDPWPKKRHAKRRLTSDRFTPIYDQLLTADGSIHQKTDSKSLFESSIMSLTQNGYQIVDIELDMHNSERENIITEYEEKFSKKGFTIKFLEAKKTQIGAKMSKRIEELVNIHGVSGFENEVKDYLKTNFGEVEFIEDNIGGVATCIDFKSSGANVLVLAHMDEVGFMLKNIKDNGICKLTALGRFVPASVVNSHVVAVTHAGECFEGIVLGESPHGNTGNTELKIENFSVDFGFASKDEAVAAGFELGIQVALKNDYTKLANNRVSSKAFDNRLGCAAILDLFETFKEKKLAGKLYLAASVQEEVGLRGASPIINAIPDQIDYALIIDVSPVKDLDEVTNGTIGSGTLIRVQDPRTVLTVSEVRHLRTLAKEHNIASQDFFSSGGTDANVIQITGSGVKTCALCVPGRNLHTQNSVVSLDDYDATIALAQKYIESRLINE